MKRLGSAVVAVVVVSGMGLIPLISAVGASPPSVVSPSAGPALSPVTVSGSLTRDGKADSTARLWATIQDNGGGKTGTKTDSRILTVPVASDGRYRLRIDPATLPASLLYKDRQINVVLLAESRNEQIPYAMSIPVPRGTAAKRVRTKTQATANFAFGSTSTVKARTAAAAPAEAVSVDAITVPEHLSLAQMDPAACGTTWGSWHKPQEKFMQIQNWRGAPAKVTQGRSSIHTLGVGHGSSYGGPLTWRVGGTEEVSKKVLESISGIVQKWAWNKVNYRDHIQRCTDGRGHFATKVTRTPKGINKAFSKFTSGASSHRYTKECARRPVNYEFTKDSARNVTVSGGVDLGPVSVTAQSGWNAGTNYYIKTKKRTWMCWNHHLGVDNSHTVQFRWRKYRGEPCGKAEARNRCREASGADRPGRGSGRVAGRAGDSPDTGG